MMDHPEPTYGGYGGPMRTPYGGRMYGAMDFDDVSMNLISLLSHFWNLHMYIYIYFCSMDITYLLQ